MMDLSRFAADMVFFTTSECGFFTIEKGYTTGSSIMPQKKNWDLFELMRGRAARFLGLKTGLYATNLGLVSGYNRDVQDTKALVIEGTKLVEQCLAILTQAVPALSPVRPKIEAALTPDLYATDVAYKMVREQGVPFRDAYVQVGKNIAQLTTPDHDATVKDRTHTGSTGNLQLAALLQRIGDEQEVWTQKRSKLHAVWAQLSPTIGGN